MLPQLYKCFQHWSAGGSVYIYSDPHFEDSDCKIMVVSKLLPRRCK